MFEDVYIDICGKSWDEREPECPFNYRTEFMNMFFGLFNDNGYYSRSEKIISIFESLVNKYPDNADIAAKYIIWYLTRTYDIWTVYESDPKVYVDKISDLEQRHNFSAELKFEIEYKKTKLLTDHGSISKLESGITYHEKLLNMAIESRQLHYIADSSDMLLTFAAKYPEVMNERSVILESLTEDIIKDYDNKDMNYTQLHLGLCRIFKSVKAKEKEATQRENERILEIMKHHEMNGYAIINFEIIVSLLIFSLGKYLILLSIVRYSITLKFQVWVIELS